MSSEKMTFSTIDEVAFELRKSQKKNKLIYAYNGTGKTRLSLSFKEIGKIKNSRDTLYFNAFTEDLFIWDNDLDKDIDRVLKLNGSSSFFDGLEELEMESRIEPFLEKFVDFNYRIDYEELEIIFRREIIEDGKNKTIEGIKISRGEERLFIWCFFLAIAQLAIDGQEPYDWVKFIYIDDPVSSLDDNNTIATAHYLAKLLKDQDNKLKTIISTHHPLFFNVLCNEIRGSKRYLLRYDRNEYELITTNHDSPFIYHISLIQKLKEAADSGNLYTYHFSILRNILEKSANFHGFENFSECFITPETKENSELLARITNILNHSGYSLFEPKEMAEENKEYFNLILKNFLKNYKFNDELFQLGK